MQVQPYITQVQAQLAAAAALGSESTRAIAEALSTAAEPAVRLAVLGAVSTAADEITAALLDAPGAPTVSVRIDRDDLRIDVAVSDAAESVLASPVSGDDADNSARISLRLPEALKSQIETAARSEGISVNTWIQRAAGASLTGAHPHGRGRAGGAGRITGWING